MLLLRSVPKNHAEYSSILTRPRLYSTLYLFLPLPKPLRFHCFVCSSKSQSHLFGNWLHSAALISIWNRQQHFPLTAWMSPAFHAASRRFLPFSPHAFSECGALGQNKMAWKLSGAPRDQKAMFQWLWTGVFLMGGHERGAYVPLLSHLITGSKPYCTLLSAEWFLGWHFQLWVCFPADISFVLL